MKYYGLANALSNLACHDVILLSCQYVKQPIPVVTKTFDIKISRSFYTPAVFNNLVPGSFNIRTNN